MAEKPKRIQRKRTKGWKMPANTVSVTRPGLFGNSFRVGDKNPATGERIKTPAEAVALFRETVRMNMLGTDSSWLELCKEHLRGKNLACWCSLDRPCHADVWLEVVNA